jgi:hypothetical protein
MVCATTTDCSTAADGTATARDFYFRSAQSICYAITNPDNLFSFVGVCNRVI